VVEAVKIIGTNKQGENVWACKCSCGMGCAVAEGRLGIKGCGEPKGDNQVGLPEPPAVDIRKNPHFSPVALHAENLLAWLRTPCPALDKADGFGYAGRIKGAYKHAAKQLDELLALLRSAPADFADGLEKRP